MMILYTMGFTQKNSKQFFELIKENQIEILVDIRLNNKSQLAGFTKGPDLSYFLNEICNCDYRHCTEYAPTKEILDGYKKGIISWDKYEELFIQLMIKRNVTTTFFKQFSKYSRVCLLCSEPTPEQCHRRLLAEFLLKNSEEIKKICHI